MAAKRKRTKEQHTATYGYKRPEVAVCASDEQALSAVQVALADYLAHQYRKYHPQGSAQGRTWRRPVREPVGHEVATLSIVGLILGSMVAWLCGALAVAVVTVWFGGGKAHVEMQGNRVVIPPTSAANCSAGQFPTGIDTNGMIHACASLPSAPTVKILEDQTVELPDSCKEGDIFLVTESSVGSALLHCTRANTWMLVHAGDIGVAVDDTNAAAFTEVGWFPQTGNMLHIKSGASSAGTPGKR